MLIVETKEEGETKKSLGIKMYFWREGSGEPQIGIPNLRGVCTEDSDGVT